MENRVIEGKWWIAGTENEESGNLVCDEKGWNLKLNGTFQQQSDDDLKQVLSRPRPRFISPSTENTILGITKDGKPITLEYFPAKSSSVFLVGRGYNSEAYLVHRFFENAHFPDPKGITFKRVLVKIPFLFEWFGRSMVDVQREYNDDGSAKEVRFICKPGSKTPIGTVGDMSLSLRAFATMPFLPSKDVSITQEAELVIESTGAAEISYDDIRTTILTFRDFLTVATGMHISVKSIVGITHHNEEHFDGKTFNPEVVIHDRFFETDSIQEASARPNSINFTFNELAGNSDTILKNWFQASQKFKDVFNVYFSTLAVPNLNLRNKFASVISAIEGLMRISDPTLRTERSLWKIINALQDLIKPYGILFATNEIELLVNTRDKFAHIELTDPTRKPLDDYQLYDATAKLCAMLEIAVLCDLGFDAQTLSNIAQRKIAEAKR